MKTIAAALLLGISGLAMHAQDKAVPPGEDRVYKTVDGQELHLWVAKPSGKPTHTAVVFFHGGGWTGGTVTQFDAQTKELAERGMLVVNVQYRLVAKAPSTESPQVCLEDAKSAMRWVRSRAKEFQIDPHRIAAGGGSAGGYLAAATALVPGWDDPKDDLAVSPKPNALVLFFPVVNVGPSYYDQHRFGDDPRKYSPEAYVSRNTPPTIIEGGGADKLVPPDELKDFKAKCDAAGAKCVLDFYPGQPHGFANKEPYRSLTLNAVMHFLESIGYLRKDTPDVVVPTQ
ncbi:Acetyl esterase/lipase [Bryocella elongata]|uniref:Acetyl esterase/lipase n=1 Tax=Bryocella elongata TaxID=863522 RepID=A0A1H6B9L6_9BACT|nr:alpha/beta hydrolase fold domain-containing protein [Bryocella elongata]SEG57310.1 Acetyl esterase/lipase [Bryocella elongata]